MKKFTLIILALTAVLSVNAEVLFNETFGAEVTKSGSYWPYVDKYDGYDNAATCEFSGWSTTVRQTSSMNPHVWFPTGKEDTLTIANIKGGEALTLSFDIASNKAGLDNANKIHVSANGVALTIPSIAIPEQNKYVHVEGVAIANAEAIVLQFTIGKSEEHGGLRIDNIKIEGNGATAVENVEADKLSVFAADNTLFVNAEEGAAVRVYSVTGALVLNGVVNNGQVALNGLNNGIYVVNVNNYAAKFVIR